MKQIELAWAAGFFDGEGHCGINRSNGNTLTIRMPQIDPRVLVRFAETVGKGKVYGPYPPKGPQCSPQWNYQAHSWDVLHIMLRIFPYLGEVKRAQFIEALRASYLPMGTYPGWCRAGLHEIDSDHGKNRDGRCRLCQNSKEAGRRARLKEES